MDRNSAKQQDAEGRGERLYFGLKYTVELSEDWYKDHWFHVIVLIEGTISKCALGGIVNREEEQTAKWRKKTGSIGSMNTDEL